MTECNEGQKCERKLTKTKREPVEWDGGAELGQQPDMRTGERKQVMLDRKPIMEGKGLKKKEIKLAMWDGRTQLEPAE